MLQGNDTFDDVDDLIGGNTSKKNTVKRGKKSDKKVQKQVNQEQDHEHEDSKKASTSSKQKKASKLQNDEKRVDTAEKRHVKGDVDDDGESGHQISDERYNSLSVDELQNSVRFLETQYNDLRLVGILEAEKRFDEFKAASDAHIQDLKQSIEKLQDKINFLEMSKSAALSKEEVELEISAVKGQMEASFKEQMHIAASDWNTEKSSLVHMLQVSQEKSQNHAMEYENLKKEFDDKMNGVVSEKDLNQEILLSLYKGLSGLTILAAERAADSDATIVYTCHQTGNKGDLLFQIRAPLVIDQDTSVEYIPLLNQEVEGVKTSSSVLESLPPYLTEEIEFEGSMLSSFFLRILTYLKSEYN